MNGTVQPHKHKFYYTTAKSEFEAIDPEKFGEEDLFKKREYMYLMCNSPCNEVKKVEVKKELPPVDEH